MSALASPPKASRRSRVLSCLIFAGRFVIGFHSLLLRVLLWAATIYLVAYFYLNSSYFGAFLEETTARGLHGRMVAETWRFGPLPWSAGAIDIRFITPGDDTVIEAAQADGEIDLRMLFSWLTRKLRGSDEKARIHVTRADVRGFVVHLDFDEDARLRLVEAFARPRRGPPKPPSERGDPAWVLISNARVQDGRVMLGFPRWRMEIDVVHVAADLLISGGLRIDSPLVQVAGGRALIDAGSSVAGASGAPLEAELGPTVVEGFNWENKGFQISRVRATVDSLLGVEASGGMDFSGAVPAFNGLAQISAGATPPALSRLTRGALDGPFDLMVRGRGPFSAVQAEAVVRAGALDLFETRVQQLGLEVVFDGAPDEALTGRRLVRIPEASGKLEGGSLRAVSLDAFLGGGLPPEIAGELWLDDVDVGALLERFQAKRLPPPALGRVSGGLRLRAGARTPESSEQPGGVFALSSKFDLAVRWPGGSGWPIGPRYRLAGVLNYAGQGPRVADDGTWPASAQYPGLLVGLPHVLWAQNLRVTSGADELRIDGGLSLSSGKLDVAATGGLERMGGLLQALGVAGFDGRLSVQEARLAGTVTNPRVTTRLKVGGFSVRGRSLGELESRATLADGLVTVPSLSLKGRYGELSSEGRLRLTAARDGARGGRAPSRPFDFVVERLSLSGLSLDVLERRHGLGGQVELRLKNLSGNLDRPWTSLRGVGSLQAHGLSGAGLDNGRLRAELAARHDLVRIDSFTLALPRRAELRAGGTLSKSLARLDLEVATNRVNLRTLAAVIGRPLPLAGAVSLDLRVTGRTRDPHVEGRLRAHSLELVERASDGSRGSGRFTFGDAAIMFRRERGGPLSFEGEQFFPGFELLPGSRVTFIGPRPSEAHVSLAVNGLDVGRLWPALRDSPLELVLGGRAELMVDLMARRAWRLALDLPVHGLQLKGFDGRFEAANEAPVALEMTPAGVRVPLLQLVGSDGSKLNACAALGLDGALEGALAGEFNAQPLRLLWRRSFARLEGTVRFEGAALDLEESASLPEICAPDIFSGAEGALAVHGSLDAPLLTGSMELMAVRMQPRGLGREMTLAGRLLLAAAGTAPDAARRQLVEIPRTSPLRGTLDEGRAQLWGRVFLDRFIPQEGRVRLVGNELYYNSPKAFHATFNPDLTFSFMDLASPESRRSSLSGDVAILEGAYYRSFDTLSRVFGTMGGRRQDTPTAPLTRALPLLSDTALDLRVQGEDVHVTSGFTFGTTDLELRIALRIGGTLADPLVWDRIEVVPGGQIVYRVVRREFEVLRGVLDFQGPPDEPVLELEARTEIPYLDEGGLTFSTLDTAPLGDEKIVGINVRVEGRYPRIDLDLSSDSHGFDQTDLQYFILTGAPRSTIRAQGADQSISLLTDDLANLASNLLLSAFVDSMTLGVTMGGGIDWGVMASLGRNLRLRTRVVQEGEDKRYRARFEFRLSEHLSLDGQLRVNEEHNQSLRTYESKLRYRIPLD